MLASPSLSIIMSYLLTDLLSSNHTAKSFATSLSSHMLSPLTSKLFLQFFWITGQLFVVHRSQLSRPLL